jgi:RimJ/RimL family protein N-acetyltransferase
VDPQIIRGSTGVCSGVPGHPDPRNEASIRVAARIHTTRSEFLNRQRETMLLFMTRSDD